MDASPFNSASALREANRLLVEDLHGFGDDFPASFLDEVEHFQQRAAATGAYLSALDDRSEAQSLINFWLTILFNGGRRPESVILDEFDMEAARARAGASAPYKGLDAFQIEDCGAFFGRGGVVREMLDRLATHRLLAVTGLSGSGKSSVVRAGLIPRLREGELPGSRDWKVVDPVVPGRDPISALSELAGRCGGSSERLTEPGEFVAALDRAGGPALVSIDQFEELFTLCGSEEDRTFVLDALTAAAGGGAYRHVVVITMRSEYDSRVETHPEFAALFAAGRIQIGALSAHELRTAIEEPAAQVGVSFDPGLPEELVQRVLGEPAGLPLLQFTLLELWRRRSADNSLTWDAYAGLGGSPREILARRATEVYESFATNQDRTFSHRIFLALAEIGSGLEPTARRVTRAELDRIGSRDSVDHVLRVWQENGLIRISPAGPIVPASQVEVAHEALIRNWDLLVGWIEDHFAETRRRRLLTERARAWAEGKDTFLGELSLREAEQYGELDEDERRYVEASRRAVDEANASLHRRKRWAYAAAVVGTLLLGGGFVATGVAVQAREDAAQASAALDSALDAKARQTRLYEQRRLALVSASRAELRQAEAAARARTREIEYRLEQARAQERAALANLSNARVQMQRLEVQTTRRIEEAMRVAGSRLAEVEQAMASQAEIVAQERPAVFLDDFARSSAFGDPSRNLSLLGSWRHLSEGEAKTRILASAESVGRLRLFTNGSEDWANAFIVADGIAAALLPRGSGNDVTGWSIDFANQPGGEPSHAFPVRRLLAEMPIETYGDFDASIVLLEMVEQDGNGQRLPPPLQLAEVAFSPYRPNSMLYGPSRPDVGLFVPNRGSQVYLIGFPGVPGEDAIGQRILGTAGVVKRLQPGFLLNTMGSLADRRMSYSASTFPGNRGSPVFDVATGKVIGIHWGRPSLSIEPEGNFAIALGANLLSLEPLRTLLPTRPDREATPAPESR